jgi:pimeloyl-ACP methyl ester carboxylesterase
VDRETRYALTPDGVSIAYQVVGAGPIDLVWVPGWVSHIEAAWDEPTLARFFEGLASFSRLILFDKRGTGLSDRVPESGLPSLETRMADLLTVLDAVGSTRSALLGSSEGAPMCVLFAASHPDRTTAMVLYGGFARRLRDDDYPIGETRETSEALIAEMQTNWGGPVGLEARAPSMAGDRRFREAWARYLRMGASPSSVVALTRMNAEIDVRAALPAVRVPTLILHRTGDRVIPVEASRYMAERIEGARLVALPGDDHLPWVGGAEQVIGEIEEFLTGIRAGPRPDRVLLTVLFTDIVGSTERAAQMGDRAWRERLAEHHAMARQEMARWRGREINTAGDGFFAVFDGPARAIRCALALHQRLSGIGISIRAGLHTGEVTMSDDDVSGLAVHIGARIAACALAGETLVSSTVKDLVVGADLSFADRGITALKGVPGEWRLYAASARVTSAAPRSS